MIGLTRGNTFYYRHVGDVAKVPGEPNEVATSGTMLAIEYDTRGATEEAELTGTWAVTGP